MKRYSNAVIYRWSFELLLEVPTRPNLRPSFYGVGLASTNQQKGPNNSAKKGNGGCRGWRWECWELGVEGRDFVGKKMWERVLENNGDGIFVFSGGLSAFLSIYALSTPFNLFILPSSASFILKLLLVLGGIWNWGTSCSAAWWQLSLCLALHRDGLCIFPSI